MALGSGARRRELVRLLGETLRAAKTDLGLLVTLEAGKTVSEGLGEVQEMIDICDYAVGLSRQLFGLTLATERPDHRMTEAWLPLGVVGVISAFNFPVAVWSWNAALALVCGDPVVWKPSEKTPLTALAVQALFERAAAKFGDAPDGLSSVIVGGREVGEALVAAPKVRLVSATGSTAMGRAVGPMLAKRFARALLELGGNNAAIVGPSADLDLTLRAVAFAAMGTAGQRCTTLRRLIVHDSVYDALLPRLASAYAGVTIGDPRSADTLVGPLIDPAALTAMEAALAKARSEGGVVRGGERVAGPGAGIYVRPALVEMPAQSEVVLTETFAPILYLLRYRDLAEAVALNNDAPQGLSSSIFTLDMREAERFLFSDGIRLRHRQRQHRPIGRGDRRRLRRREGNRRRTGGRIRLLEGLYAAGHQYGELRDQPAARPGGEVRHLNPRIPTSRNHAHGGTVLFRAYSWRNCSNE